MKRFLVIPLLMLYMLAVSGVMIHMHYCGVQLASWNIYLKTTGCGGDCGDESTPAHTCCKDKVIAAKVSQDHSLAFFKYKLSAADAFLLAALLPEYPAIRDVRLQQVITSACMAHAPPGIWQQIPLYQLHARLTYYG